jgi:hypothetical protein
MLTFAAWSMGETVHRKVRLFRVACARRVWHCLSDEHSRETLVETSGQCKQGMDIAYDSS